MVSDEVLKVLAAAEAALRSYQYGNAAHRRIWEPDLAKEVADEIAALLRRRWSLPRRCSTCRWWLAHAPMVRALGDCRLFETRAGEKAQAQARLIVTRTLSGEATVVTYPDFGCTQWEARGDL